MTDRRSEILTTAGNLFRERGYHATSMRDIAGALKLRGSSLYAHISSKEELLWEIVNHAADAFIAQAEAVDPSLSAEKKLRALIRGHLRIIAQERPRATVFFHEWKFLSSDYKAQITARRDAYEAHFRQVIEAGVRDGTFYAENPKLATLFVLSVLNWSYQWFDPSGPLSLESLSEQYTQLILRALESNP